MSRCKPPIVNGVSVRWNIHGLYQDTYDIKKFRYDADFSELINHIQWFIDKIVDLRDFYSKESRKFAKQMVECTDKWERKRSSASMVECNQLVRYYDKHLVKIHKDTYSWTGGNKPEKCPFVFSKKDLPIRKFRPIGSILKEINQQLNEKPTNQMTIFDIEGV